MVTSFLFFKLITMKLFNIESVKKYFEKLEKLSSYIPRDKSKHLYGEHTCQREVFVHRTLNFFKGKYFKIYEDQSYDLYTDTEKEFNYILKKYIFILNISYFNSHSSPGYYLRVMYVNATEPLSFKKINLIPNKIWDLIGSEITKEDYTKISSLFLNDLPKITYVVEANDFSKWVERGHTSKNRERIKVFFEVTGTTEKEARQNAWDYCDKNKLTLQNVKLKNEA